MDTKVFISNRDQPCAVCGQRLVRGAQIALRDNASAECLACAGLAHLVFLPAGDQALTLRARRHSSLVAVVLKFSTARKRSERQGLLLEPEALASAEKECLSDSHKRARQRERQAQKRAEVDQVYVKQFADAIRAAYPSCPSGREFKIAEHACLKHSGRVGRSAAAKGLNPETVNLAVIAHIRHVETDYDEILAYRHDQQKARQQVRETVDVVQNRWREKAVNGR
jgi:hypothetical protein